MNILALKLMLAPIIIGSASFAVSFGAAILTALMIQGSSLLILNLLHGKS